MREYKTTISFPAFRYRIFLIVTDNLEGLANKLADKGLLTKDHGIDDTTDGFHVTMPNQSYSFIVLKPSSGINHIAHEAYHAVCTMFRWIGAKHEEELFAYHLGYLVEEIFEYHKKVLDKFNQV